MGEGEKRVHGKEGRLQRPHSEGGKKQEGNLESCRTKEKWKIEGYPTPPLTFSLNRKYVRDSGSVSPRPLLSHLYKEAVSRSKLVRVHMLNTASLAGSLGFLGSNANLGLCWFFPGQNLLEARGDPAGSREGVGGKKKKWVQGMLLSRPVLWATEEQLDCFSEAPLWRTEAEASVLLLVQFL